MGGSLVECGWCHITETLEDDMEGYRGKFYHYACLTQKVDADLQAEYEKEYKGLSLQSMDSEGFTLVIDEGEEEQMK